MKSIIAIYIKLSMIVVFVLPVAHIHVQSLANVILSRTTNEAQCKWEWNKLGNRDLNCYNEDFCDYFLYVELGESYNMPPGKTTVLTQERGSAVDNPFKRVPYYYIYRGKFPEKFSLTTLYALPVRNGKTVDWQIDLRESQKMMRFRLDEWDTIYATRGGIACTISHPDHLLIYHVDNTFSVYTYMAEKFIQPGEKVQVGQPVGLAGGEGSSISFFFLDKNKFTGERATGYPYSHFIPMFRTVEGNMKLKEGIRYQALIDDELIMQDMDEWERKRYLKQKNAK